MINGTTGEHMMHAYQSGDKQTRLSAGAAPKQPSPAATDDVALLTDSKERPLTFSNRLEVTNSSTNGLSWGTDCVEVMWT